MVKEKDRASIIFFVGNMRRDQAKPLALINKREQNNNNVTSNFNSVHFLNENLSCIADRDIYFPQ